MELERTGYERDRAEERRRGIQLIDVKSMGRLPDDLRRREIDNLNEAMKNDGATMKVPIGLTAEQFHQVLQMRNDGDEEEHEEQEEEGWRREDLLLPAPATPPTGPCAGSVGRRCGGGGGFSR